MRMETAPVSGSESGCRRSPVASRGGPTAMPQTRMLEPARACLARGGSKRFWLQAAPDLSEATPPRSLSRGGFAPMTFDNVEH
jgi:hypothetical protein